MDDPDSGVMLSSFKAFFAMWELMPQQFKGETVLAHHGQKAEYLYMIDQTGQPKKLQISIDFRVVWNGGANPQPLSDTGASGELTQQVRESWCQQRENWGVGWLPLWDGHENLTYPFSWATVLGCRAEC